MMELARLRRDCSGQLLVRTSKGMLPTPFAEGLARAVRQALALMGAGRSASIAWPRWRLPRMAMIFSARSLGIEPIAVGAADLLTLGSGLN
jgi:DNA-binding transcriptional LysR family regulator